MTSRLNHERRERVEKLLKKEATKKLQSHYVNRPRHICAIPNTPVDTKVMWRAEGLGAEQLNRRDTSLLHAVRRGDTDEVKFLLRLGPIGLVPADHETAARNMMSAQDWNGFCSLHWAAINGWVTILEILLKAKGPLDILDTRGRTALHLAAENGHDAAVRMLVEYGANPSDKDIAGLTALQYAMTLPSYKFKNQENGVVKDRIRPDPAMSNMYENRRKLQNDEGVVLQLDDHVIVMPGGRDSWWHAQVTRVKGAGGNMSFDVAYKHSATAFFLQDDAPAIFEALAEKRRAETQALLDLGLEEDEI